MKRAVSVVLLTSIAASACGSQRPAPTTGAGAPQAGANAPSKQGSGPLEPNMRRLLLETATAQACAKTQKKLIGLASPEDAAATGAKAGLARVSGRWLVQECAEQNDGRNLSFALGGPGWMWVEQAQGGARVRQYVYFYARASLGGPIDVAFDENARIAAVWFTPSAAPSITFAPMAGVNARPHNPLAPIVGLVLPSNVESGSSAKAEELAAQRFKETLQRGATITYSTPSGQMELLVGRVASGAVPQRPFPSAKWLVNERQELHAGGFQIAGPYPYTQSAQLEATIENGFDLQYATVCVDVVQTSLTQLAAGQPITGSKAFPTTYVAPGQPYVARLSPPLCEWALLTYSRSDTTIALQVTP